MAKINGEGGMERKSNDSEKMAKKESIEMAKASIEISISIGKHQARMKASENQNNL